MRILKATIIKDLKILLRDRVGLIVIFFMPILLVIVITSVQNSTFELVNNNKISLIIYNNDQGKLGNQMTESLRKVGLFRLKTAPPSLQGRDIAYQMHEVDAMVALIIPPGLLPIFSAKRTN